MLNAKPGSSFKIAIRIAMHNKNEEVAKKWKRLKTKKKSCMQMKVKLIKVIEAWVYFLIDI